jgi:hypothetical protein
VTSAALGTKTIGGGAIALFSHATLLPVSARCQYLASALRVARVWLRELCRCLLAWSTLAAAVSPRASTANNGGVAWPLAQVYRLWCEFNTATNARGGCLYVPLAWSSLTLPSLRIRESLTQIWPNLEVSWFGFPPSIVLNEL